MHTNDSYLVRVCRVADTSASYGWELCRGSASLVVQRSAKTFATRAEALVDSAQFAASLALPIDLAPARADDQDAGQERPSGARQPEAEI